jgi:hypothetical protein
MVVPGFSKALPGFSALRACLRRLLFMSIAG